MIIIIIINFYGWRDKQDIVVVRLVKGETADLEKAIGYDWRIAISKYNVQTG